MRRHWRPGHKAAKVLTHQALHRQAVQKPVRAVSESGRGISAPKRKEIVEPAPWERFESQMGCRPQAHEVRVERGRGRNAGV
jgi:hypothetical protein